MNDSSDELFTEEERALVPQPKVTGGVPFCSQEECGAYDGKRCRLLGFRPDGICEPAVRIMNDSLEQEKARADRAGQRVRELAMLCRVRGDLLDLETRGVQMGLTSQAELHGFYTWRGELIAANLASGRPSIVEPPEIAEEYERKLKEFETKNATPKNP